MILESLQTQMAALRPRRGHRRLAVAALATALTVAVCVSAPDQSAAAAGGDCQIGKVVEIGSGKPPVPQGLEIATHHTEGVLHAGSTDLLSPPPAPGVQALLLGEEHSSRAPPERS